MKISWVVQGCAVLSIQSTGIAAAFISPHHGHQVLSLVNLGTIGLTRISTIVVLPTYIYYAQLAIIARQEYVAHLITCKTRREKKNENPGLTSDCDLRHNIIYVVYIPWPTSPNATSFILRRLVSPPPELLNSDTKIYLALFKSL